MLVGDVFRAFNPWLAIARAVSWAGQRLGRGAPEPLPYPERVGRWPAVAGILIFAWVELVYVNKDDPSTLAIMAIAYAAVQLVGMSLYGIRAWENNADAFGVYFGLFARLSPLHWTDGELRTRRPLEGVVHLDTPPGTVALLITMIGTTSFDGFSQGPTWTSLADDLQTLFSNLGFSAETALELAFTVGLIGVVLAIGGLYRIGIAGMRSVHPGDDAGELARRFVHTLVPIALAYVVAHYFSLLVYQSQALAYLASDPLGTGRTTRDGNAGDQLRGDLGHAGLVRAGRGAAGRAHRRPDPRPRQGDRDLPRPAGGRALPVLDAHGDGLLHESGALAALERRDVIARSGAVTRQLRLFA